MRIILLFVAALLCFIEGNTQTVTDIQVSQEGKTIVVSYVLSGLKPGQTADVYLYYSFNQGQIWIGPAKKVSGNVGKGIRNNGSKSIVWNVLEERDSFVGSEVIFEVRALVSDVGSGSTAKSDKDKDNIDEVFYTGVGYIANNQSKGFNLLLGKNYFGADFGFFVTNPSGINICFLMMPNNFPATFDIGFGYYKRNKVSPDPKTDPEASFGSLGMTWFIRPSSSNKFVFWVQARFNILKMTTTYDNYLKPEDIGITPFQFGIGIGAKTFSK